MICPGFWYSAGAMIHSLISKLGIKSLGGQEFLARTPLSPEAAEVRTDARKMRVYGICTSDAVDRSREIVVPDGVIWSEYESNPIVTTLHQWRDPKGVVGHAVIDGRFAVERRGGQWHYGAQFIQHGPNVRHAEEAFGLIESGVLKGVSLGFRFIGADSEQVIAPDGHPALKINRCVPFEITHLPVPDNPDAIVRIVEKGVNGRRLSQPWMDILRPMVPKIRFHGFNHKREKAMAQPMPDPAAQQADPAQQQMQQPPSPASQLPQVKPSIALLMATEQYAMGFIKFLKQQGDVQDHPEVKKLIGGLILHLSQAYRALSATHQKIQAEDPTFPNLLGHGGILAPDPTPPGLAGAAGAGTPPPPAFNDGLDDVNGMEINQGMDGMQGAEPDADNFGGSPDGDADDQGGILSEEELAGSPADDPMGDPTAGPTGADYGDVGDEDPMADDTFGEDDDQDDDQDDAAMPMKKRQKGYEVRPDKIVLVREKGLSIAFERARRLLEAHEQACQREFSGTDLNILRFVADNLDVMKPKQKADFKAWCREKSLKGIARKPVPPPMGSPEYLAEVEREIARLQAAKQQPAG